MININNRSYRVPVTFYMDHRSRDLGETGFVVMHNKKYAYLLLDDEAYRELLNDAKLYVALGTSELGKEYASLIASAKATIKALTVAQEVTG